MFGRFVIIFKFYSYVFFFFKFDLKLVLFTGEYCLGYLLIPLYYLTDFLGFYILLE